MKQINTRKMIYSVSAAALATLVLAGQPVGGAVVIQQQSTQIQALATNSGVQQANIAAPAAVQNSSVEMVLTEEQEEKAVALSKQFKEQFGKSQFAMIKAATKLKASELYNALVAEAGMGFGQQYQKLNDDWAWVGGKPGGVEGGFTARRLPQRDLENLFRDNAEARELLVLMAPEQGHTVEEILAGKSVEEVKELALRVVDEMPSFQKTYIFKVVFGKEDKKLGLFLLPNSLNFLHRTKNARRLKTVNAEVLSECASLTVARAISENIAPDFVIGQVEGAKKRWFLGTEVIGAGDDDARFENFDDRSLEEVERDFGANMDRGVASLAYGTTFLLGDYDANSGANMGVLKKNNQLYPMQFDLGHPNPGKYELDQRTFLPKRNRDRSGMGSLYFLIGGLVNGLSVEQRKSGFQEVVNRKEIIQQKLSGLVEQIQASGGSAEDKAVVEELKTKINAHLEKLENLVK